jgi:hypothetical protein
MNPIRFVPFVLALAAVPAQTTTVFPAEYAAVAEGPFNSPNLPFANGTSRVMVVYDRLDIDVPVGATVTQLGFRQDATLTAMDAGRSLQLEVRVGYTTNPSAAPVTNFDANYDGAPTTVFGPAAFVLPNLRDAQNPLADGKFFVNLTTPFVYAPGNRNLVVEYRVLGNSGGGTSFNYRLDRADFYSPVVNGPAGCQHSGGGVPALTASPVRIGASLSLTGSTGPANSVALMVISLGNRLATPFPLDLVFAGAAPTCTGQLVPGSLSTLLAVTSTTGGSTFSYPIPNQAALNDLWLSHQLLLLDAFAPGGVVVSNGTEVQIGIRPRTTIVAAQGPPATVTTGALQANYCPVAFFTWQ